MKDGRATIRNCLVNNNSIGGQLEDTRFLKNYHYSHRIRIIEVTEVLMRLE